VSRFRPSILILAVAFATLGACDKMSLVSPTGSTITLTINKTSVPINGTAEVTAAVIESAGTPVQNGTVVTFTSSFGTIDPREARTEGGTARVIFTGTQSGTAKIGAFSGGAKTAAELEVKVGAAAAETLKLRAEPPSIPAAGGSSQITVTVADVSGSPLPNAPVAFTTTNGNLSVGSATTDANGEARTTLTTTREAKVIATVAAKSGEIIVTVLSAPTVTVSCPAGTPAAPNPVGVPITCTITPVAGANGSAISNVTVNWGDGSGEQPLGNVTTATAASHTYTNPGSYTVTASATDQNGQRGTGSTSVVVTRVFPTITLTVPATGTAGAPVSMSVAPPANPSQPITNVTVDFGDGTSRNLGAITGPTGFTKTYSTFGGYTVTAIATDTSGQQGRTSAGIVINPASAATITFTNTNNGGPPLNVNQNEAFSVSATTPAGNPPVTNITVTLQDGSVLYDGPNNGSFTWRPGSAGTATFTIVATDAAGNRTTVVQQMQVNP
jgi:adhesin/invasin